LAPFIGSFHWHEHEGDAPAMALERVLPGGRVHLMVNLVEDEFRTYHGADCVSVERKRGAVLAGPNSRSTVIDTREQRSLATVDFELGGAAAFFKAPISEARDLLVGLDDTWGRDGRVLRERLLEARTPQAKFDVLEAVLLDHLVRSRERDPAIPFAASELARGVRVSEVGSRLGLLPKTFERRFQGQTGLTPKRFARVRRLQRVVRSVSGCSQVDWSQVAAQHGYADQAHFIHDFRDLTGITPTAYRPRSAAEHNHVPVAG
jgi:AraC-like DNA-binding protein